MRDLARTSFCAGLLALSSAPTYAKDAINYQDHIRPIFQQSCFNCHNADEAKGGLDLTSYRATIIGGSSGEIVMAQSSGESTLLGVMSHTMSPKMPPNGGKVADDKLELVKQWIDEGLRETANSSAAKKKKPRVDLSVGKAAVGRPDGPPIMPRDMPLGPIHHTPRPGAVADVAGHPWSPIVASTGQQQVLIHHTDTGELLGVLPFHFGQPQTLRFSWTGKLLMVGGGVGGSSGTVVLYDVQTGEQVSRVGSEVDSVLAADLDPTQRFVALGGPSKRVKGFSVATGEMLYNLDKHTEWVTALAFSPTGDYLASGDRNGGLNIWEADTGIHVYRLDGHGDSVTALAWRYDGKVLASSGEDGQVRLWEMKTGNQIKNWGAHGGGAMSVAFGEDGRLVTTGRDRLVRVWDAGGGKKAEAKPLDSIGLGATFDTSGKAVIASDLSGKLVRWSLAGDAKQVDAWSSNPPPVEVAVSQSVEQVAAKQAALSQVQAEAQRQANAAEQAQQATEDADATLAGLRQSIKAGEKNVPRLDEARKAAHKRFESSRRALGQAQQSLRQATNAFKAREGESNRVQKDYDRAVQELTRATQALDKVNEQLEQAQRLLKDKPEDPALSKRVEELTHELEQARQKVQQHEQQVDQRAEQLKAAEQKQADARTQQQTQSLAVDEATQMEQARKQEREAANQAYDQARHDLNQARTQLRPAENTLKQKQEAQAKAKQAAEQAAAKVAAAEQELARAQRRVAKWQAAKLRLQIDALKRQRDERRGQKQMLVAERDATKAEQEVLQQKLASAQRKQKELTSELMEQQQAIARAKQHVDQVKKQVDPEKPNTQIALEDAQFDYETEVYAAEKLEASIAALPVEIEAIKSELGKAAARSADLDKAIAQQPEDPGEKLQVEIDALLPRYQSLREAAGF